MILKIKEFKIEIENMVIIVAFLNIIPQVRLFLENYYVCLLFIVFHELSHMFVASIFGANINKLYIRICGLNAVIDMINVNETSKLLIYLAGPFSNLLLAIIFNKVPLIFYTNISLMAINLIPINPLDGYNILNIVLKKHKYKESIIRLIQKVFCFLFFTFGLLQVTFLKNPSILLMLLYIFIHCNKDKTVSKKKYISRILQKCYKILKKVLIFETKNSII